MTRSTIAMILTEQFLRHELESFRTLARTLHRQLIRLIRILVDRRREFLER
jgi:hypothetical protein